MFCCLVVGYVAVVFGVFGFGYNVTWLLACVCVIVIGWFCGLWFIICRIVLVLFLFGVWLLTCCVLVAGALFYDDCVVGGVLLCLI